MKIAKLLNCYIAKKRNNNLTIEPYSNRLGFTLVELLIVIAILGILAAAILTTLNVVSNINKAKIAKAKTFASSVENALAISQVGKWSFEEGSGTTAKDTSGNGNDGTLSGATWRTSSQCGLGLGGCLNFDGATNYVNSGNAASLNNITNTLTAEAWIKPSIGSFGGHIIDNINGAFGDGGWFLRLNGAAPHSITLEYWQNGAGSATGAVTAGSLNDNLWYLITGVLDIPNNAIKIYVNGTLVGSSNAGGQIGTHNDPLLIAYGDWGGKWYNGLIDEVKIYNQALLSSQIRELYAQGLPKHQLARK